MSFGGKLYTIQKVSSNLIEIIAYSDQERVEVFQDHNVNVALGSLPVLAQRGRRNRKKSTETWPRKKTIKAKDKSRTRSKENERVTKTM